MHQEPTLVGADEESNVPYVELERGEVDEARGEYGGRGGARARQKVPVFSRARVGDEAEGDLVLDVEAYGQDGDG